MTTEAKAKSRILEAAHETATDLGRLGFIDKRKLQNLEALCLEPIPACDSERIRAPRENLKVSQCHISDEPDDHERPNDGLGCDTHSGSH